MFFLREEMPWVRLVYWLCVSDFFLVVIFGWMSNPNWFKIKTQNASTRSSENRKCCRQQKDIERKRQKKEWWRKKGPLWPQTHGETETHSHKQTHAQALCPLYNIDIVLRDPEKSNKEDELSLPYTLKTIISFPIKI